VFSQPPMRVRMDPDETAVLNLRRHGIVLFERLLPPLIVLMTPVIIILWALLVRGANQAMADVAISLSSKAFVVLIIPLGIWMGLVAYDWGNDSFHVTTKRVIWFEQTFFTSQNIIEARLSQIQNVAVVIPNPIARLVDYGNVIVETAAYVGKIEFDSVANPRMVQRTIFRLRGVEVPPEAKPIYKFNSLRDIVAYVFPFWPTKNDDGSVTYHKHWFILLQAIGLPLLLTVLLLAIVVLSLQPVLLVALVILVPILLFQYVNWVNDIYILTDRRIIDVYRIPLVKEDRREALLEQIQDVSVSLPTFVSRVLDMGDVFVETAGKAENFYFHTVQHPTAVKDELNRRLEAARTGRKLAEDETRRREIETMITEIINKQWGAPPTAGGGASPPVAH
jgi:hypothetical protein